MEQEYTDLGFETAYDRYCMNWDCTSFLDSIHQEEETQERFLEDYYGN